MEGSFVKIVVFAPESYADQLRKIMGDGAGEIGNYKSCSFSIKGTGRFLPMEGASPAIGKVGELEEVAEERIEALCSRTNLQKVIAAIKKVHPYEEPAIDVYPVEIV